jgi:hypothetical protein
MMAAVTSTIDECEGERTARVNDSVRPSSLPKFVHDLKTGGTYVTLCFYRLSDAVRALCPTIVGKTFIPNNFAEFCGRPRRGLCTGSDAGSGV